MAKFLLPAFLTGGGAPAPRGNRGWQVLPMSELANVSKSLAAPNDVSASLFVDAIPDIWGKALLFAYALQDEKHTLHQRAVCAFRGFLTLLALRTVRNYNITVETVDISTKRDWHFGEAVWRLLPTETASESAGWNPVHMFLLSGEVVGICSPLTLIAPREGADMCKANALQLTNGFSFKDPTQELSIKECAALRDWLESLKTHVMKNVQSVGTWRNTVTDQIDAFKKILSERASAIEPQVVVFAKGDRLISTPLFSFLGTSVELAQTAEGAESIGTRFRLRKRVGAPDELLIMSEEIIRGLPPDTEILHGITASALKGQILGTNPVRLGDHPLPPGLKWFRPDTFFLPKLTVINGANQLVDVAPIKLQHGTSTENSPLLPLAEKIADYLDSEHVERHSWFERTSESLIFKLQLPMSDGGLLDVSRAYPFSDLNRVDAYYMPVVEIWPSIKLPGWKCFYTFWGRDAVTNRFHVRPFGVPVEKGRREFDPSMSEEVTLTTDAPGYLSCSAVIGTKENFRAEPLGLLIPAYKSAKVQVGSRTFNIGFDFGTTSTNIFLAPDPDEPERLQISANTIQIFQNAKRERQGLMYRQFLPPTEELAPFLSLLRRRVWPAGGLEPIRDAHVLFHNRGVESDQFQDQATESYLKWDSRLNDDRKAFLSQLVLHTAYTARLKGANKLRFIYSYPTAFDESTGAILASFWKNDVPKMANSVGIPCECGLKQTESIATAYYFNKLSAGRAALLSSGALVIDIGGGTSDISAWRDNRLAIQTSVRLSGREILLRPLFERRAYTLQMLAGCMEGGGAIFEPLAKLVDERFYRRADAFLRTSGFDLLPRLSSLMKDRDFECFRSEIAIRFSALLYYSGLLLRAVNWRKGEDSLPDIYVGGNGAQILHWLAPPKYDEDQPINRLLLAAYARGAGYSNPPIRSTRLVVSEEPKSEVACGLVYSLSMKLAQPDDSIQTVAGETFVSHGTERAETTPLTATDIKGGLRVSKASELENLLALYNEFTDRHGAILFPISNPGEIVDRAAKEINERILEQANQEARDINVEPLFITGLVKSLSLIRWRA